MASTYYQWLAVLLCLDKRAPDLTSYIHFVSPPLADKKLLGNADSRALDCNAKMRCDAASSWMENPMSYNKCDIWFHIQFLIHINHHLQLAECKKSGNVRKGSSSRSKFLLNHFELWVNCSNARHNLSSDCRDIYPRNTLHLFKIQRILCHNKLCQLLLFFFQFFQIDVKPLSYLFFGLAHFLFLPPIYIFQNLFGTYLWEAIAILKFLHLNKN